MNANDLISVIIPVYNVEQYIDRCIDSIVHQTYENLEIILIDDGSTDQSGVLCDSFAQDDDRIIVLHKSNGGLSDARNKGIEICKGKFITFVDSDDYLDTDCVAKLYTALTRNKADVACCEMKIITDDGRILNQYNNSLKESVYEGRDAVKELLLMRGIDTSAPGKLYKAELFQKRRYPVGKLFEDIPVMYDIALDQTRFVHVCYPGYYYFYRTDSISKKEFRPARMDGYFFVEDAIRRTVEKYPDLKNVTELTRFSNAFNILMSINSPKEYIEYYRLVKATLCKNRWVALTSKESKKSLRMKAAISLLPTRFMQMLYFKWQSIK